MKKLKILKMLIWIIWNYLHYYTLLLVIILQIIWIWKIYIILIFLLLIVLTSDVLEKHLNNLEITFMDKTINNNNNLISKPVVYFNKTDLENINKNDN